jgi:DNA uptake protein ComE-like DNA-binding protein
MLNADCTAFSSVKLCELAASGGDMHPKVGGSMRRILGTMLFVSMALIGCSEESRSPDAIRKDTANVTSAATRDAKAVALGVVDGLRQKGTVNINKADRRDLETLPGITPREADLIIAHRPYERVEDLLRRHLIPKAEYDRIVNRTTAK